jgi:hypothetical protein
MKEERSGKGGKAEGIMKKESRGKRKRKNEL